MGLQNQFLDICSDLEKNGVRYWVDLGNLLGVIREGQLIEWDSDIDIGVWAKDLEIVMNYFDKNHRYNWSTKTYQNKIFAIKGKPHSDDDVDIDVIVYYPGDQYAWNITHRRVSNLNLLSRFHSAYHWYIKRNAIMDPIANSINKIKIRKVPKQHFTSRMCVEQYGQEIHIPSKPEEYLERVYGKWREPTKDYDFWEDSGILFDLDPNDIMKRINL